MTILLAAVDGGSLSAASRQLRIPLATVSRRVSELEDHLNTRLVLRGSRRLALTDAGRAYVASCRRILEDLAEIERTASGEYSAPQGELTISAPLVVGRNHMVPVVVEFLRHFPEIRVRMRLTDRRVDLLEEQVDLALRVGDLPDSNLIATRVALVRQLLCASPDYLNARESPLSPSDLSSHDCVGYEGYPTGNLWDLHVDGGEEWVQVRLRLVVNSVEAAVAAAAAGAGIARALSYQVEGLLASRALVTLLEAYEPPPMPVSLIYPGQRQLPLKVRAFLDFATPRLRERLDNKA